MTEQDYEKLMSEEAKGQGKVFAERYPTMNGRKPHREDVLAHVFSIGHKAGVAFARANPAPEVLELVEALEPIFSVAEDGTPIACKCGNPNCFSRTFSAGDQLFMVSYVDAVKFSELLTRFKERGRG